MLHKFTFRVPTETVDEATVIEVRVSPGEIVKMDQIVLVIETAKAAMELPSDVQGVVREVLVKEGDLLKVGQALFLYEPTN